MQVSHKMTDIKWHRLMADNHTNSCEHIDNNWNKH